MTYPTDYSSAPSTLSHQIPRAPAYFAAHQMPSFAEDMPSLRSRLQRCERCILGFVFAAKSLLHEAAAVLQEIVANLAAGEGEVVQGVEIDICGYLCNDTETISDEMSF